VSAPAWLDLKQLVPLLVGAVLASLGWLINSWSMERREGRRELWRRRMEVCRTVEETAGIVDERLSGWDRRPELAAEGGQATRRTQEFRWKAAALPRGAEGRGRFPQHGRVDRQQPRRLCNRAAAARRRTHRAPRPTLASDDPRPRLPLTSAWRTWATSIPTSGRRFRPRAPARPHTDSHLEHATHGLIWSARTTAAVGGRARRRGVGGASVAVLAPAASEPSW
jgi:hypothetical protein